MENWIGKAYIVGLYDAYPELINIKTDKLINIFFQRYCDLTAIEYNDFNKEYMRQDVLHVKQMFYA